MTNGFLVPTHARFKEAAPISSLFSFFWQRGMCKEDKDWIFGDRTHPASGCKSKREGNNGHALPFARDKTPKARAFAGGRHGNGRDP